MSVLSIRHRHKMVEKINGKFYESEINMEERINAVRKRIVDNENNLLRLQEELLSLENLKGA